MAEIPTDDDEPIELDTTEARAGVEVGAMRYVLLGSMALVIVIFVILFFVWR